MGLFKQMKEMKNVVAAAPAMMQQGQALAASAQAMQAAQMGQMQQAIAYNQQVGQRAATDHFAAGFAAQRGISAADWEAAAAGWTARMTAVPAIGPEFRRYYDVA